MSHPARGAWIETEQPATVWGRTPRRTPPGVRGLKLFVLQLLPYRKKSHPARGAWIETTTSTIFVSDTASHPARGAWIETTRNA